MYNVLAQLIKDKAQYPIPYSVSVNRRISMILVPIETLQQTTYHGQYM